MKMKKYTAPSIAEAMKLVRADLGDDAVIINSKVVVKKKFFGLIKQKNFEVLAGIDNIEVKPPSPRLPDIETETLRRQENIENEQQNDELTSELKSEIADLKSMIKSLHRQSLQTDVPEQLVPFINYLKQQELDTELITAISDELFVHYKNANQNLTEDQMVDIAKEVLTDKISSLPFGGISFNRKFVNVLGPTGVGKTTTIAKMAARAVLEKKKKIAFITTDTYRIAAIDQLKTYANLLQAPVEVVYNSSDYKKAIEKLSNVDIVFIDTAGRNYKEAKYVDDLRNIINFDDDVESYLVLSLTAKEKDMESIIEQFQQIPIEKFIFTKTDETNSIGTIFNLMIKYNKGLAYYTNGQEVPEDIEEANITKLLDLFFKENLNERSS